jgi:branched-chain amino acid transport system ATP-binding protein
MILEVKNLSVAYGPIRAVRHVTINVAEGELVSVVGPNGAGKSSLLRCLSGIVRSTGGEVVFAGETITRAPSYRRVAEGLVQVPEGRAILQNMSVLENLIIAFEHGRDRRPRDVAIDEALALFPILHERRDQRAGTMSGGEQQMLALARGLVANPKLLLLDEPSLGLAPLITREVFRRIQDLRSRGVSILLVEQNVREALRIADRAYVLELGRVAAEGRARELMSRPEIMHAYLGIEAPTAH